MKLMLIVAHALCVIPICVAQSDRSASRTEAEYYVTAYAQHYRVPVALVRAIIKRESNWQPCTVSPKGAVGLMQFRPSRCGSGHSFRVNLPTPRARAGTHVFRVDC
jgi:hypothetical protein